MGDLSTFILHHRAPNLPLEGRGKEQEPEVLRTQGVAGGFWYRGPSSQTNKHMFERMH
jgi:hypothetical protein